MMFIMIDSIALVHDSFLNAFKGYEDAYTIIGGTASYIILTRGNLTARATKDYDMVIHDDGRNEDFYETLLDYLYQGKYILEELENKDNLYRFTTNEKEYPQMIELLSRRPDFINDWDGPITSLSFRTEHSLSAIMIDKVYSDFVLECTEIIEGIPILSKDGLIVLKARAWYNLYQDKMEGANISTYDLRKHLGDISRLLELYEDDTRIEMNTQIRSDMKDFLMLLEENLDQIVASRDYAFTQEEVFEFLTKLLAI